MAQEQTKRGGGGGDDDDPTGSTAAGQERREKLDRGDRRSARRDRRRARGECRGLRSRIRPKGRTVTWPHSEKLAFQPIRIPGASVPMDSVVLLGHAAPAGATSAARGWWTASEGIPGPSNALPHGTTIVALKFPGGVLIAGDRRSTQGNMIAGSRRAEGLRHRRLHGHRHRGHGGDRRRVRPAVRRRTRALREARGRRADVRGQGEPVGDHGARKPRRRAAGLHRAAAAGRLRPRRSQSATPRAGSCRSTPRVAGTSSSRATSRSVRARSSPSRR